jgi:hypothetical protein
MRPILSNGFSWIPMVECGITAYLQVGPMSFKKTQNPGEKNSKK